jgi:acylphosphatase
MMARQVFYEGRVQGVGFRYTVRNIAKGYEVTGWVRNLPDGRVELHACGEPAELSAFLTAVGESELNGHIRKMEQLEIPAFTGVKGFEIRF